MWAAWVLWHYYAALVQAVQGSGPFFDRPVLFDRWLRPFAHLGEAVARAAWAFAGAAAVAIAAAGLGRAVLAIAATESDDAFERRLFEIGLGLGALSFLLLGLAAARVFTPVVVSTSVGALAVISCVLLARSGREWLHVQFARAPSFGLWSYVFGACAIAALGCALVAALAPETEYDAVWYHLWLPQQWLQAGRPVDIVQEYVSLYPLTWELLYAAAMAIGGVVAAKLLGWLCLVLVAASAASLARVVFPRSDGVLVAALCITAPTMLWEGSTAYADLPAAYFITLSVIALWHYADRGRASWIVLAALAMGMALAIKNLSLVSAAILSGAVVVVGWRRTRSLPRAVGVAALFGAIALAPPLPWYVRAYMASGNPVFPDMYRVFGARPAERWDDLTERQLGVFKAHFGQDTRAQSSTAQRAQSFTAQSTQRTQRESGEEEEGRAQVPATTLFSRVLLPWNVTVHGGWFGASFGPLFLVLIPFAFVLRQRRGTVVLISCGMTLFIAVWASPISSLQGRFLLPLVPFAAALAAAGAAALEDAAGRAPYIISGLIAVLLAINLPPFVRWHEADRRGWSGWLTHVVRALPVAVVMGGESTEEYLARKVPSYRAWKFIDSSIPPDATVLTFSGGDHLYSHRRRIWSDATIARPVTWASAAGQEQQALAAARALGIDDVLMDKWQAAKTRELAIGSDAFRACCLDQLYEDNRFIVFRIRAR